MSAATEVAPVAATPAAAPAAPASAAPPSFAPDTPVADIPGIVARQREFFNTGRTLSYEWRVEQLRALKRVLLENEALVCEALQADLRKPVQESKVMELGLVFHEIDFHLSNLASWMKATSVSTPGLVNKMDSCEVIQDPLGVVCIIAPWNYPIQLSLVPLVGALSGGNCAIIKPSEVAPHTTTAMARVLSIFPPEVVAVVCGAVKETTVLLEQRFDHILYTGNGVVASIVMTAAAKYLTPVTLELGGKSPAIVDGTTDAATTAKRIAWGRFLNCGQSCIAPDYVLITEGARPAFLASITDALLEFYGPNPRESGSYARIINANHFKRVQGLITEAVEAGANFVSGAEGAAPEDLYLPPTVLTDVPLNTKVMTTEIFGPVLPIITVPDVNAAINFVNERPKPLALYLFSGEQATVDSVLRRTSSGSAVVNDTMMQAAVITLPFGGVGPSGMGGYHGKATFDMFTHKKSVMRKSIGMEFANDVRYPPYSDAKVGRLQWLTGYPTPTTDSKCSIQ